ncbi:hypothetical protein [Microbacterium sp.]|uniref:hypothetical protein n=1 Tax=Microbacterium sp. TaxID=51671 RepID=UPI00391DDF11
MRIRTTSTQRTYRYVRLALVAATVFLGIALAVESVAGGVPPSVSAAYYTPAGPVFVGSLSAVALALLALSGRSLEQGLLDVAAVLALVIAYVPTSVSSESCAPARRCIPAEFGPTVANNAGAVASLVVLGVVAALVLARAQGTLGAGVVATAGVVAATIVAGFVWAVTAPASFSALAHEVAAIAFFVVIAAVAALGAWRPQRSGRAHRRLRLAYGVVAIGIVATLVLLVVGVIAGAEQRGVPVVLIGEVVALALFAVFWVVQTVELWNEVDPRLRT